MDLILEENDVKKYEEGNVTEPQDVEGKAKHKKMETKAKRILVESIKDHLIPFVYGLKTSKEIYDALVWLYVVNNIGQQMALRNQLHDI